MADEPKTIITIAPPKRKQVKSPSYAINIGPEQVSLLRDRAHAAGVSLARYVKALVTYALEHIEVRTEKEN